MTTLPIQYTRNIIMPRRDIKIASPPLLRNDMTKVLFASRALSLRFSHIPHPGYTYARLGTSSCVCRILEGCYLVGAVNIRTERNIPRTHSLCKPYPLPLFASVHVRCIYELAGTVTVSGLGRPSCRENPMRKSTSAVTVLVLT